MSEIAERVKAIVKRELELDREVNLEDRFVEDLGADSLDTVEMIMAIEEEFNVEVPDGNDADTKVAQVKDVVAFIEEISKK